MDDKKNVSKEEEVILIEFADLEVFAQEGKKPPLAKVYRFKVNETKCEWKESTILGHQILEQANLTPAKDYTLREKIKGVTPLRIELDEVVDLRKSGIEKFRAIRHGQNEGEFHG